jgi:heat shock protein HslJ
MWGMRVITMLAVTAALSGCGEKAGSDDSQATDPGMLGGRTLVVTSVTDGGKPHELVPGTQVRFTFDKDNQVGVNTGCNSMGGTFEIDGDRLVMSAMSMTEMGCPEPQMKQETWIADLLGKPITIGRDPLTFTIGDVVLALVDREEVSPDLPLAGTRWRVDGLVSGDVNSSLPDGVDAWLEIADEGKVTVNTGCNQGSGSVTTGDGTLTFGPLATTRMACADKAAQEVERAMLEVLDGETTYKIVEGSLSVTKGQQGLGFQAG